MFNVGATWKHPRIFNFQLAIDSRTESNAHSLKIESDERWPSSVHPNSQQVSRGSFFIAGRLCLLRNRQAAEEAVNGSSFSLASSTTLLTLWLFNIAMEHGPFIDDVPIKTTIYRGFSMAMLNNQMVIDMIDS